MSETDLRMNKNGNCDNNDETNKTIAARLPQYRLSVESILHILKAQLDLGTEV